MIKKGESSLQKIGEGIEEDIDIESNVKKVKRFLKSRYTDYQSFFSSIYCFFFIWLAWSSSFVYSDRWLCSREWLQGFNGILGLSIPITWLVRKQKKGHMNVELHI